MTWSYFKSGGQRQQTDTEYTFGFIPHEGKCTTAFYLRKKRGLQEWNSIFYLLKSRSVASAKWKTLMHLLKGRDDNNYGCLLAFCQLKYKSWQFVLDFLKKYFHFLCKVKIYTNTLNWLAQNILAQCARTFVKLQRFLFPFLFLFYWPYKDYMIISNAFVVETHNHLYSTTNSIFGQEWGN